MKNSGTRETMQTLLQKGVCVMLSLLLWVVSAAPVWAADMTNGSRH